MKLLVFSAYDSKVKAYLPPVYFGSLGGALRAFEKVCNDPTSDFAQYPQDFGFHQIGEFDDQTGVVTSFDTFVNFGLAASYIKPEVKAQMPLSFPDKEQLEAGHA